MKSKLNTFQLIFIGLYYGMQCFLHFPFRVVEVRGAIKRLKKNISDDDHTLYKTSAITGDFCLR